VHLEPLQYTELALDRVAGRRSDPAWIGEQRARPDRRVIPLWRDSCLVRSGRPVGLAGNGLGLADEAADELVFLGLTADRAPVFAADLTGLDQPGALERAGADDVADLRSVVGSIGRQEAGLLAYARGVLYWQRQQRFCGCCGGRCEAGDGGHVRTCRDCGTQHFPRIAPAVIVLVELPGEPRRCLLGRHQGSAPNRFSTLAGFVEIGESLEDAVRREVAEEAGVTVGAVRYQGSQAWPFPAGLMIGFRGVAESDRIGVDGVELVEARWFTAAELRARIASPAAFPPYRKDSIGRALIEGWLDEA
jgi:NAD+ diphosphatase